MIPATPQNVRVLSGGIPNPPPSGEHAYFETLCSLPEHARSWSLRDQGQLDGLVNRPPSSYFTYVFGSDDYSDPQDGAKFYKPVDDKIGTFSDGIPGNQQLKMPIGIDAGAVLITWDFWYGREFRTNIGSVANYKIFQVRKGTSGSAGGGTRTWTHVKKWNWRDESDETSIAYVYESLAPGESNTGFPAGVVRREPFEPAGVGAVGGCDACFGMHYGKWYRYWIEIRRGLAASDALWNAWKSLSSAAATLSGVWDMQSLWIASEDQDATRILYRVPWKRVNTHLSSFDFECATSSQPPSQRGPLVGYGRNVVVLHNYALPDVDPESDRVFQRPIGRRQ